MMDRHQLLFCHVFVTYLAKYYKFRQGIFVLSSKNMYLVTQRTKLDVLFSQEIRETCD